MKKFTILFVGIGMFIININAQQIHRCYTDEKLEELSIHNPIEYQAIIDTRNQILNNARLNQNTSNKVAQYRIPVVFHILHAGEPVGSGSNLDSLQIISQLQILNEDFNRLNPDASNTPALFQSIAGSLDIEFVLAKVDPNGIPTSGITRGNYGQLSNSNTIDNTIKPATTWDANLYFNIWVADMDNGILGYATLPGTNPSRDGIVLDYRYVGSNAFNNFPGAAPYNGGRTATHEVGHYLGLLHTFQGGCSGTTAGSCGNFGDDLCDTPPTSGPNYGCQTGTNQNTCTESPSDAPDMPMNFMDYTNDACMNLFTQEQADVMEAALTTTRSGLLNSPGIEELFTFDGQVIDEETGQGVADAKIVFVASDFSIELLTNAGGYFSAGNFVETTYDIYAGKWGYMTKEYGTAIQLDKNSANITVSIQNGTYYDDFVMDFGWDITGNATAGVWERGVPNEATFNGAVTQPNLDLINDFGLNCYVTGNSGGIAAGDDVDDGVTTLLSPIFDLSGMNEPVLSYQRWFFNGGGSGAALDDEITIRISNGTDNVVLEIVDADEPNTNQWKLKTFNVTDYVTPTNNMRLFVEVSDFAIAGHIVDAGFDGFKVEDSNPTGIDKPSLINSLTVYPNPASGYFNIDLTSVNNVDLLEIYNIAGQVVQSAADLNSNLERVDVSTLASGMYFIRVSTAEAIYQESIVLY